MVSTVLRRTNRLKVKILFAFSVVALTISGCAGIVDVPQPTAQPITDVRTLYYPFDSTQLVYNYLKQDSDRFGRRSDTLSIFMQSTHCPAGTPPNFGPNGTPVYSTVYAPHHAFPYNVAYALDANQAFALSYDDQDHEIAAAWVDLQAPIQNGATWSFNTGIPQRTPGDNVKATVTLFDASVNLNSTTYAHVTAVSYQRLHPFDHLMTDTTTTVSWYAQGIGLVYWASYDNSHHVNSELKLLSVTRK